MIWKFKNMHVTHSCSTVHFRAIKTECRPLWVFLLGWGPDCGRSPVNPPSACYHGCSGTVPHWWSYADPSPVSLLGSFLWSEPLKRPKIFTVRNCPLTRLLTTLYIACATLWEYWTIFWQKRKSNLEQYSFNLKCCKNAWKWSWKANF